MVTKDGSESNSKQRQSLVQIETRAMHGIPNSTLGVTKYDDSLSVFQARRAVQSHLGKPSNLLKAQALIATFSSPMPITHTACERISLTRPQWHNACNSAGNGRRHEISGMPSYESPGASLVSRDASRRIIPGLWRSRWFRPATAPSNFCECRSVFGVSVARGATDFHFNCTQHDGHCRDLERERNSRRERGNRNHRRERHLYFSQRSSGVRDIHRTSKQCCRSLKKRRGSGSRYQ
jgi:hypothetical protein